MTKTSKQDKSLFFKLFIFFVIYVVYSLLDFDSSAQMGYVAADRSVTHILILSITVFLFLSVLFSLLRKNKIIITPILKTLLLLLLWTTSVNVFSGMDRWSVLVKLNMAIMCFLSYFFFYYISTDMPSKSFSWKIFLVSVFVFLSICLIYYYYDYRVRMDRTPVLTMIYYILAIVPFCLIDNQKPVIVLIFSILLSFFSMKRGAIIAAPLMFLVFIFFDAKAKGIENRRIIKYFALAMLVIVTSVVFDKVSNGFLSQRFSLESLSTGSGRVEQYRKVFEDLRERTVGEWLWGVGSNESISLLGTGIHNEWLSFLYCFGIVGLVIYTFLFVRMFLDAKSTLQYGAQLAPSAFSMVSLFFVLSMISACYGSYIALWLFGYWGFLDAEKRKYQRGEKTFDN